MLKQACLPPALSLQTALVTEFCRPQSVDQAPLPSLAQLARQRLQAGADQMAAPRLGDVEGNSSPSWLDQAAHLLTLYAFPPDDVQRPWGIEVHPAAGAKAGLLSIGEGAAALASPDVDSLLAEEREAWRVRLHVNRLVYSATLGALAAGLGGLAFLHAPLAALGPVGAVLLGLGLSTNAGAGALVQTELHTRRRVARQSLAEQAQRERSLWQRAWRLCPTGLPQGQWRLASQSASTPLVFGPREYERFAKERGAGASGSLVFGLLARSGGSLAQGRDGALEVLYSAPGVVALRRSTGSVTKSRAQMLEGLFVAAEHTGEGERLVCTQTQAVRWPSAEGLLRKALWAHHVASDAFAAPSKADDLLAAPNERRATQWCHERIESSGHGWHWPWAVPFFGTVGSGQVRQKFSAWWPAQQPPAEGGLLRLALRGMDESLGQGRRLWELSLEVPPPNARGDVDEPAFLGFASCLASGTSRNVRAWLGEFDHVVGNGPQLRVSAAAERPGWRSEEHCYLACRLPIWPPRRPPGPSDALASAWTRHASAPSEQSRVALGEAFFHAGQHAFVQLCRAATIPAPAPAAREATARPKPSVRWHWSSATLARLLTASARSMAVGVAPNERKHRLALAQQALQLAAQWQRYTGYLLAAESARLHVVQTLCDTAAALRALAEPMPPAFVRPSNPSLNEDHAANTV